MMEVLGRAELIGISFQGQDSLHPVMTLATRQSCFVVDFQPIAKLDQKNNNELDKALSEIFTSKYHTLLGFDMVRQLENIKEHLPCH